jgi:hypothetical protein
MLIVRLTSDGEPDYFMTLVERMRTAQKSYFDTRERDALIEAKSLERKVDAMLSVCSAE